MKNKLMAEGIGTFWLVFGGCGSAVLAAYRELGIGFVGVSLAFGLTVLTMAYAVGSISGGHFNPAVFGRPDHRWTLPCIQPASNPARSTSQALFAGGVSVSQLWLFWVAPVVGGILGGLIWKIMGERD